MIDMEARQPLKIGAGSMALIAFLPENQLELILSGNALRYPQYKNLTVHGIRNLVRKSQKAGYVVSEGLFHDGVTSIGIPVFNRQKETIAAITVSSISQRMEEKRRQEIVRRVKRVTRAEALSSWRGGEPLKKN